MLSLALVLRSSVDSTPCRTNTYSNEALLSSVTHCNASYKTNRRCRQLQMTHISRISFISLLINKNRNISCTSVHSVIYVYTFTSLMWRYSSMMAFDFFSTSSSVKAGFGREGVVWALSFLTIGDREKKNKIMQVRDVTLYVLNYGLAIYRHACNIRMCSACNDENHHIMNTEYKI